MTMEWERDTSLGFGNEIYNAKGANGTYCVYKVWKQYAVRLLTETSPITRFKTAAQAKIWCERKEARDPVVVDAVDKSRLDAVILAYLQSQGRGGVSASRINSDIEYTVAYDDVVKSLRRLKQQKLVTNLYNRGHRWYSASFFDTP